MSGAVYGGQVNWFWQRAFWAERARVRALRRSGAIPPRYNSRRARDARRDAAIERSRQAPRMVPAQVTSRWDDGRTRVTDFDTRTGRKDRVHETRSRAKGRDGMRPGQCRR